MRIGGSLRDFWAMILVGGLGVLGAIALAMSTSSSLYAWIAAGIIAGLVTAVVGEKYSDNLLGKATGLGLLVLSFGAAIYDSINGVAYLFSYIGSALVLQGLFGTRRQRQG